MHLKSLILVGFAASALAAPLESTTQDLPTIQSVFGSIKDQIEKMVTNVNGFDGSSAKVTAIADDSKIIEDIIATGAAKISKSKAMGLMDVISLLGDVGGMASSVETITSALTGKRADIDKASGGATVLNNLKSQRAAAKKLTDAIKKNLPMASLLGGFAEPIAKQVTDVLDKAITEWGAPAGAASAAPAARIMTSF
jgi:Hydrophobic surface binding protein A